MRSKNDFHSIVDKDRVVIEFERICDQVGPDGLLDIKQDSPLVGAVDRVLQHGLRDPVRGYWCLVRTLTHSTTLKSLEAFVKYISSSHQKGLAWTYYTMEEGSLEFYLSSLVQDSKVVQQHYLEQSVLMNPRTAQRVITAISTLRTEAAAMHTSMESMESSLISDSGLDQNPNLALMSPVDSGVALVDSDSSTSDAEKNDSSALGSWKSRLLGSSITTEASASSDNTLADNKDSDQNQNTQLLDNKPTAGIITQEVCRRPRKKKKSESGKRVSFHQDSNDSETKQPSNLNLFVEGRYSWAGEDDSFFLKDRENVRQIKSEIYERKGLSSSLSIFDSELGIEADCEGSNTTLDGTKNNIEIVCEKLTNVVKQSLGLKPKDAPQNINVNWKSGMGERGAPEGQEDPVVESSGSSEYERLLAAHQRSLAAMRSSVLTEITSDSEWSLDTPDRLKRSPFIKYPNSQRSMLRELREAPSKTSLVKRFLRSIPTRKPLPKIPTPRRNLYIRGITPDPMLSQYIIKELKEEIELNTLKKNKHREDETVTESMKNAMVDTVLMKKEETIYKVYRVTSIEGEPLLAVLTSSALYLTGLTANKCYLRKHHFPYSALHTIVAGPGQQTVVLGRGVTVTVVCAVGRALLTHVALALFRATRAHLSVCQLELADMATLRRALLTHTSIDKDETLVYYKYVRVEDTVTIGCGVPGLIRSGHLMYRPHSHSPWLPGYILLKGGFLYVFSGESGQQSPQHVLSLHRGYFGGCRRVFNSNRPHTFEMLPFSQRGINGTFQFAAADDYEASGWLQAFIETSAVVSDGQEGGKGDMPVGGRALLLTSHHLVTLHWPDQILSCTRLDDISTIRIATTCCLLEISCREVSENGGDWILYFLTLEAISEFLDILYSLRPQLKKAVVESWDSEALLTHCLQKSEQVRTAWDPLLQRV